MPVPPSVVGFTSLTQQVRVVLEPNAGEQLLLAQTAGAGTMSLTTQPNTLSPTTGMHLHFFVIGNATAGNIVITGTNPAGGAQTSITYHVNPASQNNQGYSEFTTKEAWGTVTASSIVLTTLTPCQIIVYGATASKFLIPVTMEVEEVVPKFSPQDKRGVLFKNFRVTQLSRAGKIDKLDFALYPDSLWLAYMLYGNNPTITTVPAVATTKLASSAVAATMTLTAGPASPGEFLIFAVTTNTASGTIVLNGTDNYGNAVSETISATNAATQTLYSTKRYASLTVPGTNQFTTTGLTGAHIAVTGAFAFNYAWTWDGVTNLTLSSACFEMFDGVINKIFPFSILSDATFTWEKMKEVAVVCKGDCQDYQIVGDPTSTSAGTNLFSTLAQPVSLPIVSWPGTFFLDALPGTPGTTQTGEFLTFKAQFMTGQKFYFPGDGMQRSSNITRDTEPDFAIDGTVLFQSYAEYLTYFKPNAKYAVQAVFQGTLLGMVSNVAQYENWTFIFPAKFDTYKPDSSKNPVEVAFKSISEYDTGLGYAYKVSITSQTIPTYAS